MVGTQCRYYELCLLRKPLLCLKQPVHILDRVKETHTFKLTGIGDSVHDA